MESIGGEDRGQTSSVRQVALASLIGTSIEWYDFFLYGTAAALIFNKLFFPNVSPTTGTLAAFATFGVGFFARPVGGLVFGHYGDKIGRKAMLVTTLLIMGLATFLIGLMPTYATIGILAPILLVALRFLQGFGVGGEWGGAVLMAVEHAPSGRRGFFGSWPQMGVPIGLLLSTAVFDVVSSALSEQQFSTWGWRVPFLLSIVLVGVGLFIRLRILESPAFARVKETGTEARVPILDVLRTHPKNVLLAMGMRMADNGLFYVFTVFVLDYAVAELGLPKSTILNGVLIAAAIYIFTTPFYGALSDKIGRRPLYMGGAGTSLLFAFPFFWLVDTKNTLLIWVALVVALPIFHAAMYGPQAAFFSELFGTRVRYSGASIGYQLASVFAGGLAPLIAAALLASQGGKPWLVALYMMALALISFVSVYLATETYRSEISEEKPQEREIVMGE
jgi:MFS transporter, MHS family, shikimate and dehydroshikimate transport protein